MSSATELRVFSGPVPPEKADEAVQGTVVTPPNSRQISMNSSNSYESGSADDCELQYYEQKPKRSLCEKYLTKIVGKKRTKKFLRFAKSLLSNAELLMVIRGLTGGLGQILNIVLLLYLLIYIYSIAGMIFFRENDPWNFRSVEISMLVMMRVATFDTWGENFYTNYYGCDVWPGGMDSYYTTDPNEASDKVGGVAYCKSPVASPITATIFYVSYIFIGSFGILSSIIGIIGESMEKSITESKAREKKERELVYEEIAEEIISEIRANKDVLSRGMMDALQTVRRALQGKRNLHTNKDCFMAVEGVKKGTLWYYYLDLSRRMSLFTKLSIFENTVTFTIFLSALVAGLETTTIDPSYIVVLNDFIQSIFTIDVICCCLAEPYPQFYIEDNWNKFDVAIVAVSFVPLVGGGGMILMLRLLRLLRLLKLMKRFRTLQIILETLTSSMKSIVLISGLMFCWMFVLAGFGVLFFGENDPIHFKDMSIGFVSMFQCMTLDSWSLLMYINMFGCDVIGYEDQPHECNKPKAQFTFAAIFFPLVVASLTWIMITMFIGLMTTGMEEALSTAKHNDHVNRSVRKIKKARPTEMYRSLGKLKAAFDFLDFFNRGVIGPIELYFALEYAGMPLSTEEFSILWDSIAKENFTHIDFSEFLTIALDLKKFEVMEKTRRSARKSVDNSNDLASAIRKSKDIMRATMAKDVKNEFDDHRQHRLKTFGEDNTAFANTLNRIYQPKSLSDVTHEDSTEMSGVIAGEAVLVGCDSKAINNVSPEKTRSIFGSPGITNFLLKDNLEKIKERQNEGGLFGGPHGANADAEKHHEPPDVSTANTVSNYYFTTTANRYANSPFT